MAKNPILSGKNQPPQAFDLSASDNALVTFGGPVGPGALSFTDVGYMPVNEFTIGGDMQKLKGGLDGLFIRYNAEGVQKFAATGVPTTADFTSLHYELVGYKGDAQFGRAADGTPTLSDTKNLTILAQGELIAGTGQLGFGADGGITGTIATSLQVGGADLGTVSFAVQHAARDVGPTASGFTLSHGMLNATFMPFSID